MNVLIFPTDDRQGQTTLIDHYYKLGHRVFIPKFGTLGLPWHKIATWPAMLCKSWEDKSVRNIDVHGFTRETSYFGEDYFLCNEPRFGEMYESGTSCTLIDFEHKIWTSIHDDVDDTHIDIFHTLRGGENELQLYFDIASKYFPNAKWVSSTFNHWHHDIRSSKNAAKLIPACYEDAKHENDVCLMVNGFEHELLGIKIGERDGALFASFNHNFHVRQPDDFALFQQMNTLLEPTGITVKNYGGNVRAQGADIRYSSDKGVVGKFDTLSPREALKLFNKLTACVHFKQTDWGGGVVANCLNSCTPMITTRRYIDMSNAQKYIVHNENAVIVNNTEEATNAVITLYKDRSLCDRLSSGMKLTRDNVFNQTYWERWDNFLQHLK